MEPSHVLREQPGTLVPVQKVIPVLSRESAEPGVEIFTDTTRPAHRDSSREHRVDTADPRTHWTVSLGIEVNNLANGVNARVGSAGTNRLDFMCGDFSDGAFDRILHTASLGLGLPSAECGAIVFDSERYAHSGGGCRYRSDAPRGDRCREHQIRSGERGKNRLGRRLLFRITF